MGLYKCGDIYWYRFVRNGKLIRESTRQTNKRVAQHIEAAHRASLAKGEVAIINRDLATLRRLFNLAVEWGKVTTILPRVRLLGGENHRGRVLSSVEERKYLAAATDFGRQLADAYTRALQSIRDGAIEIHTGKGRDSRRRIPASKRVLGILEMHRAGATSEWLFPAPTKSGHIEGSTLKKQHAAALTASGVAPFVLYTFRHTCITRWAKHMDPFTLHVLAGHTDMNTTKRYVHPSEADIREAMEKVKVGLEKGAVASLDRPLPVV